jgi:hypothetical protein
MWQCGHSQRVAIGSKGFPQKSHGMGPTVRRPAPGRSAARRADRLTRIAVLPGGRTEQVGEMSANDARRVGVRDPSGEDALGQALDDRSE